MNKLIVFDLDNTLTVGNSWARLNIGLGMTVKEDMRLSNEYQKTQNFSKWTVAIMNIYRQQGIPTKKQIEDILGNFQYMTGAKKCVKKFKKAGYVTAIISGSPNIFTEIICKDLDINHFKSVYSLIFNESGFLKDIVASDKRVSRC